jgi:type III pantothenate kinase
MQLIIDIGNTMIKSYVFESDQIIGSDIDSIVNWHSFLEKILISYPQIQIAIVSDVKKSFSDELNKLLRQINVIYCSADLKLPFQTFYKPKIQLGADRIALLASCCLHYPNKDVLIVDLGSCITYDWIDSKGIHQGGSISPGFTMRYKSMNDYSGTLPLLEFERSKNPVENSTKKAMHSGVYYGILNEIEGIIRWHHNKIDDLTVILTGGDAERLPKSFKNSIFAHSNFLAKGLNYILAINTIS